MSDFNKLTVNSTLHVVQASQANLCFNDGKVLSSDRYTISNNQIDIIENSTNTLSCYFNNGVATTYHFKLKLYEANTTLPAEDNNQQLVELNYVLVFVDGELQLPSTYTIINNTLTFNQPYTDNPDKVFNVVVYSSKVDCVRNIYDHDTIFNLVKRDENNNYSTRNEQDFLLVLPVVYDKDNTLFFINGVQVPFNAIQKDTLESNLIKFNIKESLAEIEHFEIIKFVNDNTTAVHFTTTSGYLTYGPYDDFNVKIPKLYDLILRFKDQTKLLIDDLRPGFIVYSKLCKGIAVITDTNYETQQLKALQIQPFSYLEFTKDQYYLEVPETTTILKYLSEYDNRYTFLPEILSSFQRIILDELQDTIQRLKNSRSIQKVDSSQINNLLKLLGFDGNIKTLTHKQRRELIEELTEFYRIVGTRSSYNLVNILQNDLKLINMEQLFTPLGAVDKSKKTVWSYNTRIEPGNGGSGYAIGDYLRTITDGDPIDILVTDVDETTGAIKEGARVGYTQETLDGYNEVSGDFPLKSGIQGFFNITTPNTNYDYDYTITDQGQGGAVGQTFINHTNNFSLTVQETDSHNNITRFTTNPKTGYNRISFTALDFYLSSNTNSLNLQILSSHIDEDKYLYKEYKGGGTGVNLKLEPGTYLIEIAGAGGAGGAADSTTGSEYDLPATDGFAGELKTIYYTVENTTTITGKVGQGGAKVKARGHDSQPYREKAGSGFNDGGYGGMASLYWYYYTSSKSDWYYSTTSSSKSVWSTEKTNEYTTEHVVQYGNAAGGQGGGSSGLLDSNGNLIIEAKGGNGGTGSGQAQWNGYPTNITTLAGGTGGGGGIGVTGGQGGKGGSRAKGGDFWSKNGEDGWIKIYRLKHQYTFKVTGNLLNVTDGEEYFTIDTLPASDKDTFTKFVATAHRSGSTVTWTCTPTKGWYPYNTTYMLVSNATPKIAVDIDSHFVKNNYKVELLGNIAYMKKGDVFKNRNLDPNKNFTYTITEIDRSTNRVLGIFTPMSGIDYLEMQNEPAYVNTGTGGILTVDSLKASQKNEDRCYIDFYTQNELVDTSKGEGLQREYRIDAIDYGTIAEGTPSSPYFWQVGFPDIDYGNISDATTDGTDFIDYGLITDKITGTWLEWVRWDRGSQWYPTNHVNLEMKLPAGVDFNSYIDTFVEQFYNLASTVVFIQTIIESFYFGKDITGNTTENATTENTGACFGIATGAPVVDEIMTVTSDPLIQYEETLQDCQFTVVPTPAEAKVTIYQDNQVLIEGIGTQTVTVDPTKRIAYRVRMEGSSDYLPHINTTETMVDTTKYVILEQIKLTPDEPRYCDITVNALPEKSNITLQIPDYPLIKAIDTVNLKVLANTKIKYTVSQEGYTTKEGIYLTSEDAVLDIDLES